MRQHKLLSWFALFAISVLLGWVLHQAGLPAAFLVSGLLTALAFSLWGAPIRLPRKTLAGVQALIGCQVALLMDQTILHSLAQHWGVILLTVFAATCAGALVGWLLVRYQVLPGTTAAWGTSPGGAAAMISMAAESGADIRVVAFMQYSRVMLISLSAPIVSHLLSGTAQVASASPLTLSGLLEPSPIVPVISTLLIATVGVFIGRVLKVPAGAVLIPMMFGALIHIFGLVDFAIPAVLRVLTLTVLGWYIGLSFDRENLVHVTKVLPKLIFSTLLLILFCALSAWVITLVLAIDPLTAYLATSPGGMDAIMIIAMSSPVDLPFVMAAQVLRLFTVLLTGSGIAKLICHYAPPKYTKKEGASH